MTRKDYQLIADSIWRAGYVADKNQVRQTARQSMRVLIATDLATSLAQDNPNFDRDRFMSACKL